MPIRYNDGAAVRSITSVYYNDGAAVRDLKKVYYNDGAAVRLVFDKSVQNFSGAFDKYTTFPASATCIGFIQADGTTNGQSPEAVAGSNWYTPTTGGAGAGYYVRATLSSGSTPSGTLNTWLSLSTAKSWSVTDTGGGTGCVLTFEISADQVTVLATGTFTLYAESLV